MFTDVNGIDTNHNRSNHPTISNRRYSGSCLLRRSQPLESFANNPSAHRQKDQSKPNYVRRPALSSSFFSLIVIIPHLIIFVKRTNKGLYTDVATKSTRAHETHGLFSSSSLSLCPRLSPSGGPVGSEPGLSGGTPVGEGELETGLQELTDVRPLDVVLLLNLGDSQDLSRAVGERVRWAGLWLDRGFFDSRGPI